MQNREVGASPTPAHPRSVSPARSRTGLGAAAPDQIARRAVDGLQDLDAGIVEREKRGYYAYFSLVPVGCARLRAARLPRLGRCRGVVALSTRRGAISFRAART